MVVEVEVLEVVASPPKRGAYSDVAGLFSRRNGDLFSPSLCFWPQHTMEETATCV